MMPSLSKVGGVGGRGDLACMLHIAWTKNGAWKPGTSADVPDLILSRHSAGSQAVVVLLLALLTRVQ
jgi:hypothetical protein